MAEWLQEYQHLWTSLVLLLSPIYLIVGFLEIISSIHIVALTAFPSDLMDGFLIFVIGAVFFEGLLQVRHKDPESVAFVVVGLILATIVFVLRVIVVSTNFLGWILEIPDWQSWVIWDNLTWSFWLYLITGVIVIIARVTAEFTYKREAVR